MVGRPIRASIGAYAVAVAAWSAFAFTPAAADVAQRTATSSLPSIISACGSDAQAASTHDDVYVISMGCGYQVIQVSRSSNGGRSFGSPVVLPGSTRTCTGADDSCVFAQAPMIAIGPHGLVYASFMYGRGSYIDQFPVVDVSTNGGKSFRELAPVPVPAPTSEGTAYGDVDVLQVASNGTIYLVWGYGPVGSDVKIQCLPGNSCSYSAGDFNIVIQKSTNGGKSWTEVHEVTPGYPDGGAVCASFVVQPNGTLDLLYNDFPTDPTTLALSPATEYFTRSTDGGEVWSTPKAVGASAGTESPFEWWIEGDLATDSKGNLLATWDTQTSTADVGWLSVSRNGGTSWSSPVQVTPVETTTEAGAGEVLMETTAVGAGDFVLAWQTKTSNGYSTYARTYSISRGFLTATHKVSTSYGNRLVWPGDRVALTAVPGAARTDGVLPAFIAWGSAPGASLLAAAYGSIYKT